MFNPLLQLLIDRVAPELGQLRLIGDHEYTGETIESGKFCHLSV